MAKQTLGLGPMNDVANYAGKGAVLSIIDFTEPSMESLKWASQTASKLQSHLTILYPYRLTELSRFEDVSSVKKNLDKQALKSFHAMAEPIVRDNGVSYDFRSEVGFVSDRVYSYSSKNEIMMIVLSRKVAQNSPDVLSDLLAVIPVPLVIVP